jgi:hypothetical protein
MDTYERRESGKNTVGINLVVLVKKGKEGEADGNNETHMISPHNLYTLAEYVGKTPCKESAYNVTRTTL